MTQPTDKIQKAMEWVGTMRINHAELSGFDECAECRSNDECTTNEETIRTALEQMNRTVSRECPFCERLITMSFNLGERFHPSEAKFRCPHCGYDVHIIDFEVEGETPDDKS